MIRQNEHTYDENALLFQQGNEKALEFFYTEFHPAMTLFALKWVKNRLIAQEIASEAFVKIWRMHWKLDSYAGIRTYLYKTVRRDCQLAVKREERREEIHLLSSQPNAQNDTPFDHLVRSETYRLIHSALKELPAASRKVITMHFFEGKTSEEIAKELHLSSSTIRNQKMGALIALRKIYKPNVILFCLIMKILLSIL
ncbi:MAG TPA: sigma-70 family RNA polymerase sigma factor [Chitinophagaceae bacterium]